MNYAIWGAIPTIALVNAGSLFNLSPEAAAVCMALGLISLSAQVVSLLLQVLNRR